MKEVIKIYKDDYHPDNMKLGQSAACTIAQLLLQVDCFRFDYFLENLVVKIELIEKGKVTLDEVLHELHIRLKYHVEADDYHEMRKKRLAEGYDGFVSKFDVERHVHANPDCNSAEWPNTEPKPY